MYPKSTAGKHASGSNKQHTREQLSELLINKFRNKYNVNTSTERDLDAKIGKEVSRVVMQDAPVGERELNEVDKVISAAVKMSRGEAVKPASNANVASANNNDDVKSQVSARSSASRAKSMTSSQVMLNPDAQIRVGMQGKVIGMTDAEWTATVNQNVAEWTMENREKMERLKGQREQMRQEL